MKIDITINFEHQLFNGILYLQNDGVFMISIKNFMTLSFPVVNVLDCSMDGLEISFSEKHLIPFLIGDSLVICGRWIT